MDTLDDKPAERGFVLPYVLIVIAIIAIAGTIAADRLRRTTEMVSTMQEQVDADLALTSAEAEAVFAFLTSVTVNDSLDLNPNGLIQSDFGLLDRSGRLIEKPTEQNAPDLWSAKGGFRKSTTSEGPVIIQMRDITGYFPLNTADAEYMSDFFMWLGASKSNAQNAVARLKDYTDFDAVRQFRGAERADYRLRGQPIPSNAPLRGFEELGSILGWDEMMGAVDIQTLKRHATLSQTNSRLRERFADAYISQGLNLAEREANEDFSGDIIAAVSTGSDLMTGEVRVTLSYQSPSGTFMQRAVEIERRPLDVEKPFGRFWIYDSNVIEASQLDAFGEMEKIKDVISTPSRPR